MATDTPDRPTIDDHPGLDNDEATDEGKMMTAEGSTGSTAAAVDSPTLEDHPGLDNDEAMEEGKQMTAEGSAGETHRRDDRRVSGQHGSDERGARPRRPDTRTAHPERHSAARRCDLVALRARDRSSPALPRARHLGRSGQEAARG